MKKPVFICLLTIASQNVFSQSVPPVTSPQKFDNHFYLQKSRQQKTFATLSVITGGLLAVAGGYLWFMAPIAGLSEGGDVRGAERTGKALVITGSSLVAISVPLFIASGKNKEKARLYLVNQ
jgi:hypothetical protein